MAIDTLSRIERNAPVKRKPKSFKKKDASVIPLDCKATLVGLRDKRGKIIYYGWDNQSAEQKKSVFPAAMVDLQYYNPVNRDGGLAMGDEPIAHFKRKDGFEHRVSPDFGKRDEISAEEVVEVARRNMGHVKKLVAADHFKEELVTHFVQMRTRLEKARDNLQRRWRMALALVSLVREAAPTMHSPNAYTETAHVTPDCPPAIVPASMSLPEVELEQPGIDEQSTIIKGYTDKYVIDFITAHEGIERNMYKDAHGVSVGRGHFLNNMHDALELPFMTRDANGREVPATRAQIIAAYSLAKVTSAPRARKNPTISKIYLTDDYIDQMTLKDVRVLAVGEARRVTPNYNRLPPQAQLALAESMYNRGSARYNPGVMRVHFNAVRRGDWRTAANTSGTPTISVQRRRERANMFLSANGPRPNVDLEMTQARMAREARNVARTTDVRVT